jgi:ABC-type antimicrobial peptide transport system permease subunit
MGASSFRKRISRAPIVSFHQQVVGKARSGLLTLLGAVGFVLLIACANVANLLLARGAARQKEMSIRAALGAGRRRVIRQLLTESLLLAASAGAMATLLAVWGVDLLRTILPDDLPRADEIGVDLRVFGFTLAVSLLTGILFGLVPALQASRADLNETIKEGGRSSGGVSHNRFRGLLVVAEVALALVLLVINEAMARQHWPDEDPIGRRISFNSRDNQPIWREIVGVVKNVRHAALDAEPKPQIYFPFTQVPSPFMTLVARTDGDPMNFVAAVRSQVQAIDRDQPISNVHTMEELLARSVSQRRFNLLLLTIFAGVALLLAAVGIYGVMSYAVERRTHEIGVRMALGARTGNVLRLLLGQGMKLLVMGVAIGLAAAFALTRFISTLLFGVRPTDPATFVAIALLLTVVALLACYIPARRATKVDPMVALRCE